MARECPCGCGRRIGYWDRRIAKNARLVEAKLSDLDTVVKPVAGRASVGLDNFDEFIRHGEDFRDEIYAVVHGELPAEYFDRRSMNEWVLTADRVVRYVRSNVGQLPSEDQ
jgi:hypothetical protein